MKISMLLVAIRRVHFYEKSLNCINLGVLMDDVYTTGATMESAAHELKRAGAASVTGLTIASGAM